MRTDAKNSIHDICRRLLLPIASLLLRCGMTWKEFSEISKSAFVEKATADFGIGGRPTNVSRVSLLTGISRKEVKRQRDLLDGEKSAVRSKTTDATRLLSGWHQDAMYRDENSNPLLLAEQGPEPSFAALCSRYGGDITNTAMLKELLKTNTVERLEDGRLRAMRRYYQPVVHDDENLRFAISRISELTETMTNNVFPDEMHSPRFGGYASNDHISATAIPRFKKFLDERGQAFLEEIDDWLTENAARDGENTGESLRLGVGLYAIEDRESLENVK